MELKASYKLTNKQALINKLRPRIVSAVEEVVKMQVDLYLKDLQEHMGTISGHSSHASEGVVWKALDEETLEDSPKFWYETGAAKNSLAVNISVNANNISVFAGIPKGSEAYDEVLWNEFGFTKGGKVIRRPLFVPLADKHLQELNERLRAVASKLKFNIGV